MRGWLPGSREPPLKIVVRHKTIFRDIKYIFNKTKWLNSILERYSLAYFVLDNISM